MLPNRDDHLRKQEGLGLTFDAWTTSANAGVLGIKVSYVDENFEYHVETISAQRITGSHDANLFENKVKDTLETRGLYGKVCHYFFYDYFKIHVCSYA